MHKKQGVLHKLLNTAKEYNNIQNQILALEKSEIKNRVKDIDGGIDDFFPALKKMIDTISVFDKDLFRDLTATIAKRGQIFDLQCKLDEKVCEHEEALSHLNEKADEITQKFKAVLEDLHNTENNDFIKSYAATVDFLRINIDGSRIAHLREYFASAGKDSMAFSEHRYGLVEEGDYQREYINILLTEDGLKHIEEKGGIELIMEECQVKEYQFTKDLHTRHKDFMLIGNFFQNVSSVRHLDSNRVGSLESELRTQKVKDKEDKLSF